ncbi:YmfQ family protein [Asaia bogorensis]|uniref:YmfQ family protein n=1 Tax=Asaia bogorensis TaxID=91915 RepID=UPI000EFB8BB7|nr:putative phage tail protein [Asaia bogorensis]
MGDGMNRGADAIREEMIEQLLPQGAAWPKDRSSNLASFIQAIAIGRATLESDVASLSREIAPGTSVALLSDYEEILGRFCSDANNDALTFAQRQAMAQARWVGRRVISRQDFVDLAAGMGFAITIMEFKPARASSARIGDAINGRVWAFVWRVIRPGYTPVYARAGVARIGERLMSWGNLAFECEIRRRSPAHTIVQFAQSNVNALMDFGVDIQ